MNPKPSTIPSAAVANARRDRDAYLEALLRAVRHAPPAEGIDVVYNAKEQLEAALTAGGDAGLAAALAHMPPPNSYAAHYPPPGTGDAPVTPVPAPPAPTAPDHPVAGSIPEDEPRRKKRQVRQWVFTVFLCCCAAWMTIHTYRSKKLAKDKLAVSSRPATTVPVYPTPDVSRIFPDFKADPALPGYWRTVGIAHGLDDNPPGVETVDPYHVSGITVEAGGLAYWHIHGGGTIPVAWSEGLFRQNTNQPPSVYRLHEKGGRTYMMVAWKNGLFGGVSPNVFVLIRETTPDP